jgi:hypothetical protein
MKRNGMVVLITLVTVLLTVGSVLAAPANVAPTVTNPGNQDSLESNPVYLQIQATDSDQPPQTLTYSATGLPPGLAINSSSGLISGTISVGAAANSPYSVIVSVSDGITNSSKAFSWTARRVAPLSGLSCANLLSTPMTSETGSTGEKPQSKVWKYDGKWWSVFPTTISGASSAGTWLWRLNLSTLVWEEVLKISSATETQADVKMVGTLAHVLLFQGASTQLASLEYSGGTYQFWSTRPALVSISLPNSETATIDVDSQNQMWLASENDDTDQIVVYYSSSPYSAWNGPLPLASNVNDDDIAVAAALPRLNVVGVLWSNQTTQRFGFRVHVDGADPTVWSVDEVPASQSALNVGGGMADDHLNLALAADGTLYAAVKTSYETSGYPRLALLVRRPTGVWDALHVVTETGSRPALMLDETSGILTFLYSSGDAYGNLEYRQSPTGSIAFGSAASLRSGSFNDISGSKQNYHEDLAVIYHTSSTIDGQYCTPVMLAPSNLTATRVSSTRIDLSWQDHTGDETEFRIERSPNGSTGWQQIGTAAADATSSSNTGLSCNTPYYYRVAAYRRLDGSLSPYSNSANATTYACQTLSFSSGWNMITLNLTPLSSYTAQSLLQAINGDTSACSEIDQWYQNNWSAHYFTLPNTNNFSVNLAIGYFVRCTASRSFTMEGTALTTGVSLSLVSGWNSVGVPYPSGFTAQSLLQGINNAGGNCSEIDRWYQNAWNAHYFNIPGTNNFALEQNAGYFVRCSQTSTFNP